MKSEGERREMKEGLGRGGGEQRDLVMAAKSMIARCSTKCPNERASGF